MSVPETNPPKEARLPTPLVLALASGMACVGIAAIVMSGQPEVVEQPHSSRVEVADGTPEAAAESFLDAWRKREHDVAARLAVGEALRMVNARAQSDRQMTDEERDLQRQVWDAMASSRLQVFFRESEPVPHGGLRLSGVAEGEFLDQPYEREIDYVMMPEGERWRVAEITFGNILSDSPALLRLQP